MSVMGFLPDLSGVLGDIVQGGRDVYRHSLAQAERHGGLPTLLMVSGVHAELRCGLERGENKRMAWWRQQTSRPVLDVNLRFALSPAMQADPLPAAKPGVEVALPDFLAYAGQENALTIGLPGGGALVVGFPSATSLTLAGRTLELATRAWGAEDFGGDYLGAWPVGALVDCVEAIADWRRRGEPRLTVPFEPTGEGALVRVMRGISGVYLETLENLNQSVPPTDEPEAPPPYWAAWVLDRFETDVQVYQGDEGELLAEAGNLDRQRIDLTSRASVAADPPLITLTMGLTDVIVSGGKHRDFLDALAEDAAAKSILGGLGAMAGGLPAEFPAFDRQRLSRYLRDPSHAARAVVARMRHDDTDLVLLQGPAAGMDVDLLCQASLRSDSKRRRHVLLGARSAPGVWCPATAQSLAPRYFFRLFHSLHAWQRFQKGPTS